MANGERWTPSELAALKARLEFGTSRIVDDDGDWLVIAGGVYLADGSKVERSRMETFMDAFLRLVQEHGLVFLGSHHLAVEDELDGGPAELDR